MKISSIWNIVKFCKLIFSETKNVYSKQRFLESMSKGEDPFLKLTERKILIKRDGKYTKDTRYKWKGFLEKYDKTKHQLKYVKDQTYIVLYDNIPHFRKKKK